MPQMNYSGCWDYPKEKMDKMVKTLDDKREAVIPGYTASDKNKVLKVKADGSGLEWATDAT